MTAEHEAQRRALLNVGSCAIARVPSSVNIPGGGHEDEPSLLLIHLLFTRPLAVHAGIKPPIVPILKSVFSYFILSDVSVLHLDKDMVMLSM